MFSKRNISNNYKFLVFANTVVFVSFVILGLQNYMTVMLLSLFMIEVIYATRNLNKNIAFALFLVAFFTFLMGRLILPLILDMPKYSDIFFSFMDFKKETYIHVTISLYITLFFLFWAYTFTEQKIPENLSPTFDPDSPRMRFTRKWAKILMWISFPFALLVVLEKIRYVLTFGYAGMLVEQESHLPSIVIIFSVLFEYMVYLFLATLPTKRESALVVAIYVFFSLFNLIGGDRGECVMALFVTIYYYFLRNRLHRGDAVWIGRKGTWGLVLAAPMAAILLFSIAFLRDSKDMNENETGLLVGGFFYQQSASMNVIACAYEDDDQLPKGKLYSIGPIIDYFRINYISRLLLGVKPYPTGSSDLATKGNSLDSAITYLEAPQFYESGGGMGSSFVAEAFHDFGYIGIVLYSLLYGFVLASIPKWNSKNIWLSVVALVFLKYIMYAPRARATAFIASAASVSFWPIAFIIFIASLSYSHRKNVRKQKINLH